MDALTKIIIGILNVFLQHSLDFPTNQEVNELKQEKTINTYSVTRKKSINLKSTQIKFHYDIYINVYRIFLKNSPQFTIYSIYCNGNISL